MSSDNEHHSTLKVNDKRIFDSEGNVRGETPAASSQPSNPSTSAQEKIATAEQNSSGEPQIDFSSFVMSLATQAMMQLGEIPSPPEYQVPKDVIQAKQTIDILSMLEAKTKGNLEEYEANMIEEVLHSLRMAYVRHK